MGRPTKYKAEYVEKVDEYLLTCVDKVEEFHKTRGEKSDSYDRILKVTLPSVVGLAIFLDVNKDTLYGWAEKYPDFSVSLKKVVEAQEKVLLEKGASGEYNSTIAKLILSSNHGMAERKDVTSGGEKIKGINYVTPEE